MTLAAVKKKISESEHEKAAGRLGDFVGLGVTPSEFIIGGIDLEEQQ